MVIGMSTTGTSATQLMGLALAGAVAGAGATFVVTGATADAQTPAPSVQRGTTQGNQQPSTQQAPRRQQLPQGSVPGTAPQVPSQSHQWGGGGAPDTRSGGS